MKALTKPSGLTGDTKPYPLHMHEWTEAEFRQFLINYHYPPCTFRDRMSGHRQAVIEALYKGKAVPYEVLADYPDAPGEAAFKHRADKAWAEGNERTIRYAQAFREVVDELGLRPRFIDGIRSALQYKNGGRYFYPCSERHNTYYRVTVEFQVDNKPYWANLYDVPPRYGYFGKMRDASKRWQVRGGTYPCSAVWEPLLWIDHDEVCPPRNPRIDVIDSREHRESA